MNQQRARIWVGGLMAMAAAVAALYAGCSTTVPQKATATATATNTHTPYYSVTRTATRSETITASTTTTATATSSGTSGPPGTSTSSFTISPTISPIATLNPTAACTFTSTPGCVCNGDFEGGVLWDQPAGWSVSWSNQPAPYYPLTATGQVTVAPANTISECAPGAIYWPYVRVVNSAAAYNAPALNTVFQGVQSAEVWSSRGQDVANAACGNLAPGLNAPWAEMGISFVIPSGPSECIGFHYAGVFMQAHPNDPGSCRFDITTICNGSVIEDLAVFDWSAQVLAGANGWNYLPWQTFTSKCVPPGCQMEIRFRARGCVYTGHACFGYVDAVACAANCCR